MVEQLPGCIQTLADTGQREVRDLAHQHGQRCASHGANHGADLRHVVVVEAHHAARRIDVRTQPGSGPAQVGGQALRSRFESAIDQQRFAHRLVFSE